MAKAAGAACNMRCDYCYYLDKERLYKQDEDPTPRTMMAEDFLERYIRQYIEAQPKDTPVTFTARPSNYSSATARDVSSRTRCRPMGSSSARSGATSSVIIISSSGSLWTGPRRCTTATAGQSRASRLSSA